MNNAKPFRPPFDAQVFKELHEMAKIGIIKGELMAVHNDAKRVIEESEAGGLSVSETADLLLALNLLRYE